MKKVVLGWAKDQARTLQKFRIAAVSGETEAAKVRVATSTACLAEFEAVSDLSSVVQQRFAM